MNISQYLLILVVAIIFVAMLASLIIIPCLREKIKEILKKVFVDLKFKKIIISVTGAFLDLSFSLVTQILVNKNGNWKFKN